MRKTRERTNRTRRGLSRNPDRTYGGIGGGGVLPIVHAGQPLGLGQIEHPDRLRAGRVDQPAAIGINPAARGLHYRDRHDCGGAGAPQLVGDRTADRVVDADNRGSGRALMRENAPFCGDIARHPAMPVEMVWRDVEQHGDIEGERVDQLELKRAGFEDIGAVAAERRQRQSRRAEIAADLHLPPCGGQNVADQRRRRRFAVGAGDPDIACIGPRPAEQLDIADDFGAGRAGACHDGMRRGMEVRNAGRQHQRRDLPPIGLPPPFPPPQRPHPSLPRRRGRVREGAGED